VTRKKHFLSIGASRSVYVFVLLALVVLAWCAVYRRWTPEAWATPVAYSGDALGGLVGAKAMARGEILPIVPKFPASLGAPFEANWNDYPTTEEGVLAWSALLARVFGLFSGLNLTLLSAHLLAAATFYFVCRHLRYSPLFSLAGAALFSLSRYSFARSLAHLTLTFYWHIPLGVLVVAWCLARTPVFQKRRNRIFALVVAVLFGAQSPYYSWLFAQFLLLAAVICCLRGRKDRALWPVLLAAAVFATFVVMNFDTLYCKLAMGPNAGAISSRSYPDLERYALKPIDLILPLGHRINAIETWSAKAYFQQALFLGEAGAPYLGIVAIGSLVFLIVRTAAGVANRSIRQAPSHFWSVLWILSYSVVGGIGGLFGVAGLILFRCSNRYSIAILALLLLFFVRELTRFAQHWSFARKAGITGVIVALGLFDQLPHFYSVQDVAIARWQVTADRTLVSTMESRLPARAMVFQLPVVDFPEAPPIEQMADYEEFRPYLHSRNLRFSYGSDKGRPRERWQRETEQLGAEGLVKTLERYGFAAILIDRAGYKDGGSSLVRSLKDAGRVTAIAESYQFICIALNPVSRPLLPGESNSATTQ
jgi:hypothetical protein